MLGAATQAAPPAFELKELAEYRLSPPVFKRFEEASRLIAAMTPTDSALAAAPLFTRDIAVSGDAPLMATKLEARLRTHGGLAQALRMANITSREYTKFALTLFAARLAHGFIRSGALRKVAAGVAADNVKFIDDHEPSVAAILQQLGLENP